MPAAILIILIVGIPLISYLVMKLYPGFGSQSAKKGTYANQVPTSTDTSLKGMIGIMKEFAKGDPKRKPSRPLPAEPLLMQEQGCAKITWFGHSALLLELDGKTLLLDPMFGKAPSPFPFIGGKRYRTELPYLVDELPQIDAVVLSHDHYDHLDHDSIKKLKDRVGQFFVPLGVGAHLKRWGVEADRVRELNWWNEVEFQGLTLACTPSRHFSGRSLLDRDATLWCSWVIAGRQAKVYFSGDSGYGPHFQEIGEKYGPFDMTFMECGQYDERWAAIHMMPEETVQAHVDLKGKVMIPIHWAAFTLSLHAWTDPVERASQAAGKLGVSMATPKIGETVAIGSAEYPTFAWWRSE